LLLTDPPYGIDYKPDTNKNRGGQFTERVHRDDEPFDPSPLIAYRAIIWGSNNFASRLPDSGGWIVWDKVTRNGINLPRADCELAWSNVSSTPRVFRHMWAGAFRDSERGSALHSSQKPVALMRWILDKWTKPGDLVFDPYMGSGPVARACLDLGRRYIGVEIVEEYCQAAVDRLGQLAFPLEG
jgi:site-specific DNA-methyltransferase (adenine-specific)